MVGTNYKVTNVPALHHLQLSAWSIKKSPFSGESRPSDKGGPDHSGSELRWGWPSSKKVFRPFGPHFCLKIRGGGPPPGPPLDPPLPLKVCVAIHHFILVLMFSFFILPAARIRVYYSNFTEILLIEVYTKDPADPHCFVAVVLPSQV